MCPARNNARRGFTLIELLVVVGILALLTVLGYFLLPPLASDYNRVRSLDQISEYLLSAKMRAKRDGLPTGIRLLVVGTLANQIQYIQQPDALSALAASTSGSPGVLSAITPAAGAVPTTATFTGVDFVGAGTAAGAADALVQAGDYLELLGGGPVHLITGVSVVGATTSVTLQNPNPYPGFPSTGTTTWRILRQPRLLQGEDVKQLPADYVIDLGLSLNAATKVIAYPSGPITAVDVLFSTAGSLLGQGTAGKIVLYVRDGTATSTPGPPGLVAVNSRSGYIGAYDVNDPTNPAADHYLFTEDGRSGGL
jgi:prepilin-type N-terminal cleavage/methylation domain-containing protein